MGRSYRVYYEYDGMTWYADFYNNLAEASDFFDEKKSDSTVSHVKLVLRKTIEETLAC